MARSAEKTTTKTFYTGVGRRKTAIAQIRLLPGSGQFVHNGETITPESVWLKPLELVGKRENTDVSIIVRGGGFHSQSDAITLGIARALIVLDESLKPTLRKAGLVTVDARV